MSTSRAVLGGEIMKSTMQESKLSIPALVRRGATLFPESKVFTFDGMTSSVQSFATTAKRAAQFANSLKTIGVKRDDCVATFCFNHNVHLEAYLAIPSCGAIMHTLNIRLFSEQLQFIIDDAQDKVILVDGAVIGLLARILPSLPSVEQLIVVGDFDQKLRPLLNVKIHDYEELISGESSDFEWEEPLVETDAAAMCYTSGTTGDPKGVVYSHRSTWLHSNSVSSSIGLASNDRVLVVVPMFHVNAWGLPYAAWLTGCDLVLPGRYLQAPYLVKMISELRPTIASGVPVIWNDLIQYAKHNEVDFSSLRMVSSGGSAAPNSLIEAFENDYQIPLIQGWGMTETSPICTLSIPPDGTPKDQQLRYLETAGKAVAGVTLRVVDDAGYVLEHDGKAQGEIQVTGPWITASYFKGRNPECFDGIWLRTGDIGTIDEEGYLKITDRTKDVIKSGGEWISSVELENMLMDHEAVYEATIVGVPDVKWQERPLACIVLMPDAKVKPEELRDFLVGKVARWWIPERWAFVEEIPKTSVGKFNKRVVRDLYAKGEISVINIDN